MPRRTLLALPTPPRPPANLPSAARPGFDEFRFAAPHKAFAVAPRGAYGWRSGLRTADEARAKALDSGSLPPLGLHIVIGEAFPTVTKNMLRNLQEQKVQLFNAVLERA